MLSRTERRSRDRIPPFPQSENGIPNGVPFLLRLVTWRDSNAALSKPSGGRFVAVTEEFCEAYTNDLHKLPRKIQERIPPFPPNKDGIPFGMPFLFFVWIERIRTELRNATSHRARRSRETESLPFIPPGILQDALFSFA